MKNLFENIDTELPEEVVQILAQSPAVRIERIVSLGHGSANGFWYDQPDHEWVVLLEGSATVEFADQPEVVQMGPGDFIHIPAHRKHRVAWTTPDQKTIWLAIHYAP
jgi:cupin 2 domain-containing protein